MNELGTPANPVTVSVTPQPVKPHDLVMGIVVTLLPVAIAVLMQKPALRHMLAMRALHMVKITGDRIAEIGNLISGRAATEYNKVRL